MTGHCTHKVSYSVKSRKTVSNQDIQSRGRLNNPLLFTRAYYLILKMVLIPLLQVICTAVVLVYAEPEGKALIVFSYRLECFVFQFFFKFLVNSYQRNIKTFLGFSLISRRGVILIFSTTLLIGAQISRIILMFLRILTMKHTQDYRLRNSDAIGLCKVKNYYASRFASVNSY